MPKILIYATDGKVPFETRPELIAAYDMTVEAFDQVIAEYSESKLRDNIRHSLTVAEVWEQDILRKA
jgi:hypothetical protein